MMTEKEAKLYSKSIEIMACSSDITFADAVGMSIKKCLDENPEAPVSTRPAEFLLPGAHVQMEKGGDIYVVTESGAVHVSPKGMSYMKNEILASGEYPIARVMWPRVKKRLFRKNLVMMDKVYDSEKPIEFPKDREHDRPPSAPTD